MKIQTTTAAGLRAAGRLDTEYFLAGGQAASQALGRLRASGLRFARLGAADGLGARVWAPSRFKRAYAAPGEPSVPYLRPHDVFSYLPEPADLLSVARSEDLDDYRMRPGLIVQTCSGRNLGPAVMADAWLARFALSHDMIRIEIADEDMRAYVLAYMNSRTGQEVLRRDMTGSVIDHLTARHVAAQDIPIVAASAIAAVVSKTKKALRLRETARLELNDEIKKFDAELSSLKRRAPLKDGWTVRASKLAGRLDAAFYDPLVATARRQVQKQDAMPVREVARVVVLGRYKRLYSDSENGLPIISGAQLLQSRPVHLQHILPSSFDDVEEFKLRAGWICYPSDGRAEEALGTPVVVTRDREGWLASNMVGRIIPNKGVDTGWLYLALRSAHAQVQFKAAASGSVIDHTYPPDMERVLLPRVPCDGRRVMKAWDSMATAQALEDEATALIDHHLAG